MPTCMECVKGPSLVQEKKNIPWYGMKNLHIPCSSLGHRRGFGLLGVDNESMKMAGLVQPVGLPTRLV